MLQKFLPVVLLFTLGCAVLNIPTVQPTSTPEMPSPTPTVIPSPTVEPADTLLPQAKALCDAAADAPIKGGYLHTPSLALIKSSKEDGSDWAVLQPNNPAGFAVSATEVHTLLCIQEGQIASSIFKYTDGSTAYVITWDVKALSWPDGKVLGSLRLFGDTLLVKNGPGPGIGPAPQPDLEEIISWVDRGLPVFLVKSDCAAFSEDGTLLASVDTLASNGSTSLWDVHTGEVLWTQSDVPNVGFCRAKISPDNKLVAISGRYETFLLSADKGEKISSFTTGTFAFAPDGKMLALGNATKEHVVSPGIWLFDPYSGATLAKFPKEHFNLIDVLTFSADGQTLISGASDGSLVIWDVASRKIIRKFERGLGGTTNSAISSDSALLATAPTNDTVLVWDIATGEQVAASQSKSTFEAFLMFLPGTHSLLYQAAGEDLELKNTLYLWDVETGESIPIFKRGSDVLAASVQADKVSLVNADGFFIQLPLSP